MSQNFAPFFKISLSPQFFTGPPQNIDHQIMDFLKIWHQVRFLEIQIIDPPLLKFGPLSNSLSICLYALISEMLFLCAHAFHR